jgi:hypothetical protein
MQYDPKQGIDPATVAALNAAEDRKDAVRASEKRQDRIEIAHYEAWTKTAPSVELGPGAEDGPYDMKRARPYERVVHGPRDPQQSTGTLFNSTQDREAVKKASQDPLQDFLDRRQPAPQVERDPRQRELPITRKNTMGGM